MDSLARLLPEGAVSTDPQTRREKAIDSWALTLLQRNRGDDLELPAAVAFPSSTEEVATVLSWASKTRTPVVPRGNGSGVCGAARPGAGSVVLDMSRMNAVTGVDPVSWTADVQAGLRGDDLEKALEPHGLTVGHYPQSIGISTVGGWIAAASAGQASTGFGAIEDVLLGLTAVTAQGEILRCRPVPRSAAGPDLRRLLVGSEGRLAVITEATLACRARPSAYNWLVYRYQDFGTMAESLRDATRAQPGAVFARGYDETDARLSFGALGHEAGCVALLGFPEDAGLTKARDTLRQKGKELSRTYADHWYAHRNDAVALYQAIMGPERAFGPGVIVDTAEVAGLWSAVPRLYAAISGELATQAEAVACHLSHLYRSGSSLYFTFLIRGADDSEAQTRYLAAWDGAMRACTAAGGTITHHHGVGRLKAAYLEQELGTTGAHLIRKIKATLDPEAILNP